MSFPELLALAAALAMDALAVSIAAGITLGRPRPAQLLRMPLAFGLFQAAMPAAGWLLVTGFCGGFTTFSTFSADAVRLLREECYTAAATYVGLSVAVCIVFAAAGMWIGTTFRN